jgi:hypothetical protein
MCCFSGNINKVSGTKIFARIDAVGVQFLAYAMDLDTPTDVAMILPIPIQKREKVNFIDLSEAPDLFTEIEALFKTLSRGMMRGFSFGTDALLVVEKVGAFDASFVPSIEDMDRLDKRFAINKSIWDKIPQYKDFGFVVFKLSAGDAERHPMAFSFKSANPKKLFFPTIHVHHGELPRVEHFDHVLYSQGLKDHQIPNWYSESDLPSNALKEKSRGILDGSTLRKRNLHGELPNQDIYADVEK